MVVGATIALIEHIKRDEQREEDARRAAAGMMGGIGLAGAALGALAPSAVVPPAAAAGGAAYGAGGAAAALVSSTGPGTATGAAALGPVGWLVLGASGEPTTSAYTYDCWKQVVHDMTPELSSGRLLREIMMDPRVKQVIKVADNSPYPEIILENIWDEKFRIEYVLLPSNELAAHALLLSE